MSFLQVIYIAPLKAIVRERMNDWRKRLVSQLGKKMVCYVYLLKTKNTQLFAKGD